MKVARERVEAEPPAQSACHSHRSLFWPSATQELCIKVRWEGLLFGSKALLLSQQWPVFQCLLCLVLLWLVLLKETLRACKRFLITHPYTPLKAGSTETVVSIDAMNL